MIFSQNKNIMIPIEIFTSPVHVRLPHYVGLPHYVI